DRAQRSFDPPAALQNRSNLRRRDAGPTAVGQPEVTLVERGWSRVVKGVIARIRLEELQRQLEWMTDLDTTTKNDRAHICGEPIVARPEARSRCSAPPAPRRRIASTRP